MQGLDNYLAGRVISKQARLALRLAGTSINKGQKARNMQPFHRPVIARQFDIPRRSPQGPPNPILPTVIGRHMLKFALSAATAMALCLPAQLQAQEMDEAAIRALVLDTIRQNPEIIREAIELLRAEEVAAQEAATAEALKSQLSALHNDPNAEILGNPDGDITVVEFFDYNCGYCRRVFPSVSELIAGDRNIRVVLREWPILGEESEFAARASLASRNQGKYEEFHVALMANEGRASQANVLSIADDLGMDVEKLMADMQSAIIDAHFETSRELAQALGINGTPAFVFEDQLIPGAIELDQMRDLVAELRG